VEKEMISKEEVMGLKAETEALVFSLQLRFFLGGGPILFGPTKNKAINMAMKYDEI
jgi:hypothetical protein